MEHLQFFGSLLGLEQPAAIGECSGLGCSRILRRPSQFVLVVAALILQQHRQIFK